MSKYKGRRLNTGGFIMYSGITKIYYRKTVGHVFTKPVQIEGTTQNLLKLDVSESRNQVVAL